MATLMKSALSLKAYTKHKSLATSRSKHTTFTIQCVEHMHKFATVFFSLSLAVSQRKRCFCSILSWNEKHDSKKATPFGRFDYGPILLAFAAIYVMCQRNSPLSFQQKYHSKMLQWIFDRGNNCLLKKTNSLFVLFPL